MSAVISAPAMRRVLSLPKKAPSEAPVPGKWRPSGNNPKTVEAIEWLRTLPCCAQIRPLRIGIKAYLVTILPPHIDNSSLVRALRWWCTQKEYLQAAVIGADRIDVDGYPVGTVSKKQAAYSLELLKRCGTDQRAVDNILKDR